jgi:hypothetical protein
MGLITRLPPFSVALLIRPLNIVQASHPFRDKTREMDGARCLYLRADNYRSSAEAAHRMGAWPWKSPVRRPRM